MVSYSGTVQDRRRLLEESYVLIERLKKLRALDCDPRTVGINSRIPGAERTCVFIKSKRRFR